MKTLKSIGLGLLAAATLASTASAAPTVVRIVGSSAFRTPDTAAVIDFLKTQGGTLHGAFDGSSTSLLGANGATIANGTIAADGSGSATYVIEMYWTGSLAGVVDLASSSSTDLFMDPSSLTSTDITTFNGTTVTQGAVDNSAVYGGGTALAATIPSTITSTAPAGFVFGKPDLAFSDSINSTIRKELANVGYTSPVGNTTTLASLLNEIQGAGQTITDAGTSAGVLKKSQHTVGIVPFQWVIGNSGNSTQQAAAFGTVPANITQQAASALIGNGFINQSFLTGGSSSQDTTNFFYLVGRNEDSGTRIDAFSEANFGVTGTPVQFQINTSGGAIASVNLYPATALNTEPNLTWNTAGHSGYPTGSGVKGAIGTLNTSGVSDSTFSDGSSSNDGGNGFFIGYLGITDAAGVTNGIKLNYNGVPFSVAAVENGQYTFWSYEHVYKLASLTTGNVNTAVNSIADDVLAKTVDVNSNGKHTTTLTGTTPAQVDTTALSAGVPFTKTVFARSTTEGLPVTPQ